MIYEHHLYLLQLYFVALFLNACQSINATELTISPKIFRRPMTLFNNYEFTFKLIDKIGTKFPQVNAFEYILDTIPNDKQLVIYVQGEHSLVHYNCENKNFPLGNISVIDHANELYHCRIVDPDLYLTSDIIIEYSMMNIYNMESTSVWRRFLKKVVYVPAIPFDYEPSSSNNRNESISRTIIYLPGRRYQILHELNSAGMTTTNHAESYTLSDQSLIYSRTKILLNIHQSENHHTLEEFRVLPALLRGAIIVSEDIPIKHVVPYHNYIIWSHTKDPQECIDSLRVFLRANSWEGQWSETGGGRDEDEGEERFGASIVGGDGGEGESNNADRVQLTGLGPPPHGTDIIFRKSHLPAAHTSLS
jgi:hypothetical protein